LTSDLHAEGYNFGERGLRNPNKKLNLASTSLDWDLLLPKLPDDQLDSLWVQRMGSGSVPIVSTQNPRQPLDVSDDGYISPLDAVLVINYLNAAPNGSVPTRAASLSAGSSFGPYLDTSGDGVVSPLDAVMVINYLNSRTGSGEGAIVAAAQQQALPATAGGIVDC
jgi:hypothetical protein